MMRNIRAYTDRPKFYRLAAITARLKEEDIGLNEEAMELLDDLEREIAGMQVKAMQFASIKNTFDITSGNSDCLNNYLKVCGGLDRIVADSASMLAPKRKESP